MKRGRPIGRLFFTLDKEMGLRPDQKKHTHLLSPLSHAKEGTGGAFHDTAIQKWVIT
ncbi:MAG: hypothetical protein HOC71_15315 [Candidatus Latescibacteria bacterium]|jgi:hypothetical protein|nr:hypothetical protein [Candidatus Latescibacterota bacterium]